jgi:hypothetical protein
MSTHFVGSQEPADPGQTSTKCPAMENAPEGQNRVAKSSSVQDSCNVVPPRCSASDAPVSGSNDARALTAREFAQSVECWLWQQQCWAQQMNWMSWMHYSMPLLAAASAVTPPMSTSATSSNEIRQNIAAPPYQHAANLQQQAGTKFVGFIIMVLSQ